MHVAGLFVQWIEVLHPLKPFKITVCRTHEAGVIDGGEMRVAGEVTGHTTTQKKST